MRVPAFALAIVVLGVSAASADDRASGLPPRLDLASIVPTMLALELVPPTSDPAPPVNTKRFTSFAVVIGGDLGANASDQPVVVDHVMRHGRRYSVAELTRGLDGALQGDLVFANLETVVTARNDIAAIDKAFNFRTHPNAVRQLVARGFNVLSTANNHAIDYGEAGLSETIRHLDALRGDGLFAAPGVGFGRDAAIAPADVMIRGVRAKIAAVGIGAGHGHGGMRATMASYHGGDFGEAVRRLGAGDADIRMLSVHFGQELSVTPGASDMQRLQDAVRQGRIDVVAGHHAHVAAGVQEIDGRYIFYGLGNLMHPGMQDMGRMGACRDFGMLATVHFGRYDGEAFAVRAVEVRTLKDMHAAVTVREGDEARLRLGILNHLADGLDDRWDHARGVRFSAEPNGRGLHCTARAFDHDDDLAARCRSIGSPVVATAAARQSCGGNALAMARMSRTTAERTVFQPPRPSTVAWRMPADER